MSRREASKPEPRIAYVVTVDLSTKIVEGQIGFLARNGFRLDMICSPGPRLESMREKGAMPWPVSMKREIAVANDILSLWRLWRLFRVIRPDIVVAGTPKAGLLGTVAARFAGVPHVEYMLHGLRFETAAGIKRRVLKGAEWIACHAANSVRCVSPSLSARIVALGLASAARCVVIRNGTSDGVPIERFTPAAQFRSEVEQLRQELAIPQDASVIGFVGRMTRDKGIQELYEAFRQLQRIHHGLRLLLLGDFEPGDPVPAWLRNRIEADPAVIRTGFVNDAEHYYRVMDVMAVPTYREGFPTALLEAQSASVPVVTTDATGAIDAIVDGETGLRVPVHDTNSLACALDRLLGDPQLRNRMGAAGRLWVERNFRREDVWQGILAHYRTLLDARKQESQPLNVSSQRVSDARQHH
jgi:glycosyltransferase involved in cell wall biosynthesis